MDIGELKARITADTAGLHRGLDKSNMLIGRASPKIEYVLKNAQGLS